MKIRKFIFVLVICLSIIEHAYASHIVGGSMSLRWVSGNNYELTLKVLRDCYNANPNANFDGLDGSGNCVIGVFDETTNGRVLTINMGVPVVTALKIEGPNCASAPDQCTQLGVYKKTIQFNPAIYKSTKGYYFSYQRCCRNKLIQNIVVPSDKGITVYMEVPPFSLHNTTPSFSNNPFTYLCTNNPFSYNFDFTEPDGDELRYSIVTPLNTNLEGAVSGDPNPPAGPYPDIEWLPGYDVNNEIKGTPPLNINPSTGQISVTASEVGVFVASILVEELRNGIKIGEVRLELQFNVTNCLSNAFPEINFKNSDGSWSNGNYAVRIPNKICLDIQGSDINDSIFMKITGAAFNNPLLKNKPYFDTAFLKPISNNPFTFEGNKMAMPRLCWQTDCSMSGMAPQFFQVEIFDNGCPIPKSSVSGFKITIDSMIDSKPVITIRNMNGDISDGHFEVRIPDEICFDMQVTDPGDSMHIEIAGDPFNDPRISEKPVINSPYVFESFDDKRTRLCWKSKCDLTGFPDQKFTVMARSHKGCFPPDVTAEVTVKIDSMPLVNPPDLLCMTLVGDNETIIEYGDSTLNDPFYMIYHVYRAVNSPPFELYDSIYSRVVKTAFSDLHSPQNKTNNYMYYITAVNQCGTEGPASDIYETLSNLKPTPDIQKLYTVTVEDNNHIRIAWPETWEKDFARYFIYKAKRGSNDFVEIADYNHISDTVFTDHDVNVHEQSYCYYVIMKDTCQNYGPEGKISCSILLKGESVPFESHINWTPYDFWDAGTRSYSIQKADLLTPYGLLTEGTPMVINYVDSQLNRKTGKFYYYIVANANDPASSSSPDPDAWDPFLMQSRSNEIELIQRPVVYVPNAFTPNGDGVNDLLAIRDVFVKDYELKVYNKWGQLVFSSTDKNTLWNGEAFNNIKATDDVFVYLVSYTGWDESVHYKSGNVTLLR